MKVKLNNIRNIAKLEFEVPRKGVYLLTGLNGSGKTTLLIALCRIGYTQAFSRYFNANSNSTNDRIDLFKNSSIEYLIDDINTVTYEYLGKKKGWRPKPDANSKLLIEQKYFSSVTFVNTSIRRLNPTRDELQMIDKDIKDVDTELKEFLVNVLDNTKWKNLKRINTRRETTTKTVGGKAQSIQKVQTAHIIEYQKDANQILFYSEKNFSLGELCVLRLACELFNMPKASLLLIDEIELGLHPKAQVKLLKEIERVAKKKDLTVLFSTHSSTLINNTDRKNIILLKENPSTPGLIEVLTNVYPAQVLGELAFTKDISPDFIFLVEDMQAQILLEAMIYLYFQYKNLKSDYCPTYRILPIGGYPQVLEFLENSGQIFSESINRFIFFDKDVQDEVTNNSLEFLMKIQKYNKKINYLPCTPEVGIQEYLEPARSCSKFINYLKDNLRCGNINFLEIVNSNEYQKLGASKPKNNAEKRNKAKKRLEFFVNKISEKSGQSEDQIFKLLYQAYCSFEYENPIKLLELFGPIFNTH